MNSARAPLGAMPRARFAAVDDALDGEEIQRRSNHPAGQSPRGRDAADAALPG